MSDGPVHTFRYGGREFRFVDYEAADHINATMQRTRGFYEIAMLEDMASRLFFPQAVVDVGAHVGNHSVFFAGVLGASVIAIEPNPSSRATLHRNLALNSLQARVDVKAFAAAARRGHGTLIPGPVTNSGQTRVDLECPGDVEVAALDDLIDRPVQMIKVDVEGGVEGVILGGLRVIARDRPLIYAEVESDTFPRVSEHLGRLGYVAWKRFNHTPTVLFLPSERFGSNEVPPSTT